MIAQGVPFGCAHIADGLAADASFLDGIFQCLTANASELAELHRVEPLVLGDGIIESGKLFLDPVDCGY